MNWPKGHNFNIDSWADFIEYFCLRKIFSTFWFFKFNISWIIANFNHEDLTQVRNVPRNGLESEPQVVTTNLSNVHSGRAADYASRAARAVEVARKNVAFHSADQVGVVDNGQFVASEFRWQFLLIAVQYFRVDIKNMLTMMIMLFSWRRFENTFYQSSYLNVFFFINLMIDTTVLQFSSIWWSDFLHFIHDLGPTFCLNCRPELSLTQSSFPLSTISKQTRLP